MMKITIVLMIVSLFSLAHNETPAQGVYNLLIGTYSAPEKSGIYVYSFDTSSGAFTLKSETAGITNPSYLAVSEDQKNLYAVNETGNGNGAVSSFSFDKSTGKLTYLNKAGSGGDDPCYVTVDSGKKFVFVGNYSGGSLAAIAVNKDGSLNTEIQSIQHEGSGVLKNQEKAHVHSTVLSNDGRYLFVPDLGTDKVNIYHVDYTKQKPLTPATPAFISVKGGNGPRHFVFDERGKCAYLIQEMTGVVTAFDYSEGKLTAKQSVTLAPENFSGRIDAADIHLSPDGRFLYGSLRGDVNEIVIYKVEKNGSLVYVARQSTLGKTPRNFAIAPGGNFLLAANQNSNDIIIFARDPKTGLLKDTGKKIMIDKPVCLKFAPVH